MIMNAMTDDEVEPQLKENYSFIIIMYIGHFNQHN